MNELEKRARKHKRKQKYPMSIFPDYKKGAEEFNKNSTPINQDALSSADASSGMAEDIERNKKKGINEEMDDFLYWEIAEPQCTGYDCDDNIEYVYGDNENRVWIEQDGRKYKVFVNQVDEKPTATFTSLNKAKAFGEKYWQDNYGYINESYSYEEKYRGCKILGDFNGEGPYTVVCLHKEYECPTREEAMKKIDDLLDNNKKDESLNETLEYNEDIKIDGFEFSEYENHHTGEMEVETYYNGDWVCSCEYNGWDGLRIVDENSHYRGIINEEDVEQLDVDDFYDYCLNLKDEFEERNRSAFDPMDESLSEEYIPDITQRYPEGFNGESAYRTPWDDEYRAWDELSRQQKEEEEEFERLKKTAKYKLIREYDDYDSEEDFFQTKQDALNYVERLCDVVYRYNKNGRRHPLTYLTLENIKTGKSKRVSIEDMLDYYNGLAESLPLTNMRYINGWVESIGLRRKNESLTEGFSNGTLSDFNPQDLMDKVKSRLEAINTIRTNGNMKYMISIHPHGLFARLSPETKYDVYIVSEDEGGNQEWVSSYEEFSNLLDTEVVAKLNDWKNNAVSVNESFDNDDYDRPVLDKSNRIVNSLISNLNSSGFEVEDYEIKDNDIVVRFYDNISDRNFGFLRRSFSGPTKAFSSVTALNEYKDDEDTTYNNMIFELQQ